MDEATYQQWWQLHVRTARGESLRRDEQTIYDAGRHELEQDEKLGHLENAKQARVELQTLERERRRLEQRRQQLDGEIAALEGRLEQPTRQLLGAEE